MSSAERVRGGKKSDSYYSSFIKGGGRRPEDFKARNPSLRWPSEYSLYKRENNIWWTIQLPHYSIVRSTQSPADPEHRKFQTHSGNAPRRGNE